MLNYIKKRIDIIKLTAPGYISALSSGYLLTGVNILAQFILIPFYLKNLNQYEFGLLMMLLSIINFAAIGVSWMTSGLVRMMGEYWAKKNLQGFRNSFVVGKYLFTIYALCLVLIVIGAWLLGEKLQIINTPLSASILLVGLYFVLLYENIPERQAFVGSNRQAVGNQIEVLRVILSTLLIWLILPKMQDMIAVWVALICGVLFQRITTAYYWSRQIKGVVWGKFRVLEMKPILKRLAGKQGVGYVSYGALLLTLQADVMIVGFLGGPEAAGQFILLWKIPEALGLLLWRIPSTIEPRVVQLDVLGSREGLYQLFNTGRRWFFVLAATTAFVYILFGQWITQLWVGQFAPTQNWMYVLAGIGFFLNSIARWPVAFSHALIWLMPINKIMIIEVICKVLMTLLLYDYVSIMAPIIASILVHGFYVAFAYQKLITYQKVMK